jgi:DNA-binding CsgD family transcriptional regulator
MLALVESAPPNAAGPQTTTQLPFPFRQEIIDETPAAAFVDPAFLVAGEALAHLGSPALVLDENCKVLFANVLVSTLKSCIRLRGQDTVTFHDPIAQALLRRAIADIVTKGDAAIRAFAARCSIGDTTAVARILPLRCAKDSNKSGPRGVGILVFTRLTPLDGPPERLLRALFDFTPAEARVARGLAAGATVEELACAAGVSRNTVRSQLRGVMAKTGCRRQAEAVGLFCRVSIAGGPDETAHAERLVG